MENLSQEEVEILPDIESSEQNNAHGKTTRAHSFRRLVLQEACGDFAHWLGSSLFDLLKTDVEVNWSHLEQITYAELLEAIPIPSCLCIFDIEALETPVVIELELNLAFSIIDRHLSGKGEPPAEIRELTEIEQAVIAKTATEVLKGLEVIWQPMVESTFGLRRVVSDLHLVRLFPTDVQIISIGFEVRFGSTKGKMNIYMPSFITNHMEQLKQEEVTRISQRGGKKNYRPIIEKQLMYTPVLVQVFFPSTSVTVEDLTKLQPGDIIQLDMFNENEVVVKVGGLVKFKGKVGLVKKRRSVQILD